MTWGLIWYSFHVIMPRQVRHNTYSPPPSPKRLISLPYYYLSSREQELIPNHSFVESLSAIPSVSVCTGLFFNSILHLMRVCTISDASLAPTGGQSVAQSWMWTVLRCMDLRQNRKLTLFATQILWHKLLSKDLSMGDHTGASDLCKHLPGSFPPEWLDVTPMQPSWSGSTFTIFWTPNANSRLWVKE